MSGNSKNKCCSGCKGQEFDIDDQGNEYCTNCGRVRQGIKFDNNVVFGEQKQMLGKNINTNCKLLIKPRKRKPLFQRKETEKSKG